MSGVAMSIAGVGRAIVIFGAAAALSGAAPGAAWAQGGAAPPTSAERQQLEQQVRARIEETVRVRLRLTDEQATRLSATNRQFEARRRDLARQERAVRVALLQQLVADSTADQQRVGDLIDAAIQLQRQRLDLLQDEQRELAKFLSPVQRARYLTLEEQLRRRVDQLRRQDELRRRGAASGAH